MQQVMGVSACLRQGKVTLCGLPSTALRWSCTSSLSRRQGSASSSTQPSAALMLRTHFADCVLQCRSTVCLLSAPLTGDCGHSQSAVQRCTSHLGRHGSQSPAAGCLLGARRTQRCASRGHPQAGKRRVRSTAAQLHGQSSRSCPAVGRFPENMWQYLVRLSDLRKSCFTRPPFRQEYEGYAPLLHCSMPRAASRALHLSVRCLQGVLAVKSLTAQA